MEEDEDDEKPLDNFQRVPVEKIETQDYIFDVVIYFSEGEEQVA